MRSYKMCIFLAFLITGSAVIDAQSTGTTTRTTTTGSSKNETPQQRRTRLQIEVQKICPFTGESLSSNDNAVAWKDPETKEVLYACCKKCLEGKPDAKHLEVIRANMAKAQGVCLVMENDITEKSKHGVLDGRFVYVCCPPCIKKMTADSEKFLKALDDRYEEFLKK